MKMRPQLLSILMFLALCTLACAQAVSCANATANNCFRCSDGSVCSGHGTCNTADMTCVCSSIAFYEADGTNSADVAKPQCPYTANQVHPGLVQAIQFRSIVCCALLGVLSVLSLIALRKDGKLKANLQSASLTLTMCYAFGDVIFFALDPGGLTQKYGSRTGSFLASFAEPFLVTGAFVCFFRCFLLFFCRMLCVERVSCAFVCSVQLHIAVHARFDRKLQGALARQQICWER